MDRRKSKKRRAHTRSAPLTTNHHNQPTVLYFPFNPITYFPTTTFSTICHLSFSFSQPHARTTVGLMQWPYRHEEEEEEEVEEESETTTRTRGVVSGGQTKRQRERWVRSDCVCTIFTRARDKKHPFYLCRGCFLSSPLAQSEADTATTIIEGRHKYQEWSRLVAPRVISKIVRHV